MNITDCEQMKFHFDEEEKKKEDTGWRFGDPDHDGVYIVSTRNIWNDNDIKLALFNNHDWCVFNPPCFDKWRTVGKDNPLFGEIIAWMPLADILPEPYCKEA